MDGKNVNADEFSFRFEPVGAGAGFHGRERGDDGEYRVVEVAPSEAFGEESGAISNFLSILVTRFPMSATCFCKCEKRENR